MDDPIATTRSQATPLLVALCLTAAAGGAALAAPPSVETVETSIVIDASADAVWKAIATAEGLESWIAPEAHVELAIGGEYEIYFWPDRPVGKRGIEGTKVLSFVPGRLLSYQGSGPSSFPRIHLQNVAWVTYTIQPLEQGGVEVHLYGSWPEFGEEWEEDYRRWVKVAEQTSLDRLAAHLEGRPHAPRASASATTGAEPGTGPLISGMVPSPAGLR